MLPVFLSLLFALMGQPVFSQTKLEQAINRIGGVPKRQARRYARLLIKHGTKRKIDPFLLAALIHRESRWDHKAVSKKNYGLMQVRVSRTTNPHLIGKESRLFNPSLNVKRGVRMLAHWKGYHFKNCKPGHHPWWSHHQWGAVVRSAKSGVRVWIIYQRYADKTEQAWW